MWPLNILQPQGCMFFRTLGATYGSHNKYGDRMAQQIVLFSFFAMDLQFRAFELNSQICSAVSKEAICTTTLIKLHGLANMTPICQQEPCLLPIRRGMALESNFGLRTIEAILKSIPSGWWKVLRLLPNKFDELVTNPKNKVQ